MDACRRWSWLACLALALASSGCASLGPWSPLAGTERRSIFQPAKFPAGDWNPTTVLVQDASFAAADGTKLHGWYVRHAQPRAHALLLHGNAGNVTLLADTLRQMAADGVKRALAFVTSGFSSYSSCRQYRENIAAAQAEVGPAAPVVDKLRVFFNHPGFIEPMIESTRSALEQVPIERRADALLIFSAHSIPLVMAQGCRYVEQLREACGLVAEGVNSSLSPGERAAVRVNWQLVYQSRSGPPHQPWLEPDINDFIKQHHAGSTLTDIVVVPIGFISDHMEVLYDLDTEVRQLCDQHGIHMIRAATVGTHRRFVQMIRELIEERIADSPQRLALGTMAAGHDICPDDCCTSPSGRGREESSG